MLEVIDHLQQALARPIRPRWGKMAPELSYGRQRGPARNSARRAAVLIALFQHDGEWSLPLTVRHTGLSRHQGQISLPGGLIEPSEASAAAAVREFAEELGPADIELIGQLDPCFVYVSDTLADPWIGVMSSPKDWQPSAREVERVIEMPLAVLTDCAARRAVTIRRGPLEFNAPGFMVGQDHVWGATAVMLEQLANLIRV
jgi:8-oxo-dGTP pyrophosphatase MutT (NUDIX family)